MANQTPSAEWLSQLDDLLAFLNDAGSASEDALALAANLAKLDPELVTFLLEQVVAQGTPEAAAFLEVVATQAGLPKATHAQARAGLTTLTETGITAAAPDSERFLAGHIQQNRETGEQILLLGWRLASGEIEAMVFLLNWRGDGLRDYYITHTLTDAQWNELVEHNGEKGAPLTEIALPEARALLDAALAESRRYSRKLPQEYRLAPGLVDRRILRAEFPSLDAPRTFIAPELSPEDLISAYVAALSYRDYSLAVELLAEKHESRAGHSIADAAEAMRIVLKHAPRREEDVEVAAAEDAKSDRKRVVVATGVEVTVQPSSGKRVRSEVRERYTLTRQGDAWRIAQIERLN